MFDLFQKHRTPIMEWLNAREVDTNEIMGARARLARAPWPWR
jgi:hypothetical protein